MSPKRPSSERLTEMLSQPLFRRDDNAEAPSSTEAASPMPMLVDTVKIRPYDRNPRRVPNATYRAIKNSIRAAGLDQVLVITQRPESPDRDIYMIAAGGNTRLAALQELWQETGETRFSQVWCQYRPWRDDTHALLAHIRENDLRSDLTLIDRALAIRELRQLFEAEADRSLSQRDLKQLLADRGYQIGRTMIGWYDYAVNTLHPLIPVVLAGGFGRHQIERVYALQRAFAGAWASLGLNDPTQAQELFAHTLLRHDDDTFSLDALRRDLETELSVSADCEVGRASLELGAALSGRSESPARDVPPDAPDPGADSADSDTSTAEPAPTPEPSAHAPPVNSPGDGDIPDHTDAAADAAHDAPGGAPTGDASTQADAPTTPVRQPKRTQTGPSSDTSGTEEHDDSKAPSASNEPDGSSEPPDRRGGSAVTPANTPTDIKSLRARCWTLASRLAQNARLGDVVQPITSGAGYLMAPVPAALQQNMHPDTARTAICAWWHLAIVAEQFARHGRACAHMPAAWRDRPIGEAMRVACESEQAFAQWQWTAGGAALFEDVPGLDPADSGPCLYRLWTDRQWADWVALVETYRLINHQTYNDPWATNEEEKPDAIQRV